MRRDIVSASVPVPGAPPRTPSGPTAPNPGFLSARSPRAGYAPFQPWGNLLPRFARRWGRPPGAPRAGYTLIELCVTAIATILLMGVVYNLFTHNVYEGALTEWKIDLSADARMAMHRLTVDVKRAHAVSTESAKLKISCFTGKPKIGFPNNGTEAAQVEAIEYYLEKNDLVRNNLTTHRKDVVAKNVISFRPSIGKGIVALALEAEVEVVIERQKYDKVRITLLEKVHPAYLSERAKYKGYFCSVDEDGTY